MKTLEKQGKLEQVKKLMDEYKDRTMKRRKRFLKIFIIFLEEILSYLLVGQQHR